MVLVNAMAVYKLQHGDKIALSDIRRFIDNSLPSNIGLQSPLIDEILYRYFKHFSNYGLPLLNFPFLNHSIASFNIYDFIRNWSLFNIGEVVSVNGDLADKDLSIFNRILLREAGLSDFINTNVEGQEFENNLTVMVAHLNLDDEK
jgi:hypothetical protein